MASAPATGGPALLRWVGDRSIRTRVLALAALLGIATLLVATTASVSARTYLGSRAYEAVGSVTGSRTSGVPAEVSLIYRGYVTVPRVATLR